MGLRKNVVHCILSTYHVTITLKFVDLPLSERASDRSGKIPEKTKYCCYTILICENLAIWLTLRWHPDPGLKVFRKNI